MSLLPSAMTAWVLRWSICEVTKGFLAAAQTPAQPGGGGADGSMLSSYPARLPATLRSLGASPKHRLPGGGAAAASALSKPPRPAVLLQEAPLTGRRGCTPSPGPAARMVNSGVKPHLKCALNTRFHGKVISICEKKISICKKVKTLHTTLK